VSVVDEIKATVRISELAAGLRRGEAARAAACVPVPVRREQRPQPIVHAVWRRLPESISQRWQSPAWT